MLTAASLSFEVHSNNNYYSIAADSSAYLL